MMQIVTIENHYGNMFVHRGKAPDSHVEWIAANQFEIRLKGAFKPLEYDAARNLALQVITDARLPAIALKRVVRGNRPNNRAASETKKMF
jgi:hypothetical protein